MGKSVVELVRVASLSGYFETMASLGADPRPLLREQGLSGDLLVNPDQHIPALSAIRLLERSATATGCSTLGLRMSEGRSLANLGAASLLVAHQPTLRAAFESLREFRARINPTLVVAIEEGGGQAILREDFTLDQPEPWSQSTDLALGVFAKICISVLGDNWQPQLVCFTHQAPPPSELPIYSRIFRCRPQFDSEFNGIVLAASDLDRPNRAADPELARHARQLLVSALHPEVRTRTEDTEQTIRLLLPSARASIQLCAAAMGTTVRTLQRELEAEGTSFSTLLHRIRQQLATQYLANPRMRITDIAGMLGYSTIGAFTRWHGQAFGHSPRQARVGRT
jgi:AraC-like DNA-binding protein